MATIKAGAIEGQPQVWCHPTAEVSPAAQVGPRTMIWNHCQVREAARIGADCVLGKDVYVDFAVEIGDRVKIQNGAMIYHGTIIESGAFIGPGAIFTNDRRPRSINRDGTSKRDGDWCVGAIRVCRGASVGAGAIILPDVTIGAFAMIGAGAVVTRDVPPHALVMGNPARHAGYVCVCGTKLTGHGDAGYSCPECSLAYQLPGGNDDSNL